mmetsp:Transcript_3464/g.8789  ORF Transcript_3464/g.8789 Transcript_3464/m.8789 type:complete len:208 (+) Transcript_3464:305-928(+)
MSRTARSWMPAGSWCGRTGGRWRRPAWRVRRTATALTAPGARAGTSTTAAAGPPPSTSYPTLCLALSSCSTSSSPSYWRTSATARAAARTRSRRRCSRSFARRGCGTTLTPRASSAWRTSRGWCLSCHRRWGWRAPTRTAPGCGCFKRSSTCRRSAGASTGTTCCRPCSSRSPARTRCQQRRSRRRCAYLQVRCAVESRTLPTAAAP